MNFGLTTMVSYRCRRECDLPDIWVRLRPAEVIGHLDTLVASIVRVDKVTYSFAWGRAPVEHEMHDALLIAAPRLV